jgi:hypothetical protein
MTDPIAKLATWLAGNVEWMRHRAEVDEFLTDVEACHRVVRSIARGPAEQKFLGPCGAPIWTENLGGESGMRELEGPPCDGDVYAYRGARTGRCKTCGAQVDTSEREAWLDGEVRQHVFRAAEIANAYGVKVDTIRSWHTRGQLANHGSDVDGRPLFNVGEVLDLAAADKARRETERAKRERRKTKEDAA